MTYHNEHLLNIFKENTMLFQLLFVEYQYITCLTMFHLIYTTILNTVLQKLSVYKYIFRMILNAQQNT